MAGVAVLRAAEREAAAWKNGGGVTREVAAQPEGVGLEGFQWRVSLADVARGGPFSVFPGVDRVITVVRGAGMALTVDGVEHRVDRRFRPFAFPGDAGTDCRLLEGPLVDFNVMTRRDQVSVRVEIVAGRTVELSGPDTLAVVLEGTAALPGSGEELAESDAVRVTGGAGEALDVRGTAAVLVFAPVGDVSG
ncbi:HutD/Ves family protein [Streptacidiphilus carbonis]|uniref:HutD/Ves family protein n=1 Tax=Streptacidiphilus carbonis TaxID=105422 RepID=UPI0005A7AA7C|nr:HutD family protein [Streptacidiphilus carbonis]